MCSMNEILFPLNGSDCPLSLKSEVEQVGTIEREKVKSQH